MSNNRQFWDRVAQPPKDALKQISGGRLKGMTDISPQWRLEAMTDLFGPIGIGWWYTIDDLSTRDAPGGEVLAFARISLYYTHDGTVSQPIPGIGGSMMVSGEKNGLYASDEAYKMALTDALSVAFKALGIGADIYRGRWDGSKYRDAPTDTPPVKGPDPQRASIIADIAEVVKTAAFGEDQKAQIRKEIKDAATIPALLSVRDRWRQIATSDLTDVAEQAFADDIPGEELF